MGFIRMKGADRGCSKCLSAVLSHTVFRKINTTNLGEEITLNEIIKTLYSKKKKKNHFRRVPGI